MTPRQHLTYNGLRRLYGRLGALLLVLATCLGAGAAEIPDSVTILEQFTDSTSTIIVSVPDGLLPRLLPQTPETDKKDEAKTTDRTAARQWRIQVYSDNNKRTARGGAERRQKAIAARLPQMSPRVSYNAPYWKVFVGPFRSESEARTALQRLQGAFPAFSREMRIVR